MALVSLRQRVFEQLPLIGILRGIEPSEVLQVATVLLEAGWLCLEIPLNSPDALLSISRLRKHFEGRLLIGAGTVMSPADVKAVKGAGAEFVVSPNTNPLVIRATKLDGLLSIPGFATPTEAFAALEAGADVLKLFPAEAAPPPVLRALQAVLPAKCPVFPVGGIAPQSMAAFVDAGATGFGIGSSLFRPGVSLDLVRERALGFIQAWRVLRE